MQRLKNDWPLGTFLLSKQLKKKKGTLDWKCKVSIDKAVSTLFGDCLKSVCFYNEEKYVNLFVYN